MRLTIGENEAQLLEELSRGKAAKLDLRRLSRAALPSTVRKGWVEVYHVQDTEKDICNLTSLGRRALAAWKFYSESP